MAFTKEQLISYARQDVRHLEDMAERAKNCEDVLEMIEQELELARIALASLESVAAPVVPDEMTPEMMRAVQLNSELGAYAVSNLSGAYDLFSEFWKVACRAAMLHGAKPESQASKLTFEQWLEQQHDKIEVDCGCVSTEVFMHWLRAAYEAGNSPATQNGWMSCSERMPEKYDFDIWVFSPSRGVLDGLQWDGSMFTDDEYQFVIHDATHWMRKAYPAAPQQEGE